MGATTWTEERTERVTQLWKDGLSANQISCMLGGVTRNAVIGKVHRLGLAGRACKTRSRRYGAPTKDGRARKSYASTSFVQSPLQKAMAKIRSEPMPPPSETDIACVSFADLEPHHCRFIPGDPAEFGSDKPMYCGDKTVPGISYCPAHAVRCHGTPVTITEAQRYARSRNIAKVLHTRGATGTDHTFPVDTRDLESVE